MEFSKLKTFLAKAAFIPHSIARRIYRGAAEYRLLNQCGTALKAAK
jgi:hypothetical protein